MEISNKRVVNTHNKAFKRDSQRLAASVQSLVFVFMAQWFKLVASRCSPLNAALYV
ncbi:hypothetical protein I7104_005193 [Vibrio parahaemolyticus]|nr:hypothetical protein [Vibrio parahaemolyticus]